MTRLEGQRGRVPASLIAGAAGGLLLTWLQVPAGALVGAVFGSAAASSPRSGQSHHRLHRWVRNAGLVLLGCVSAARLGGETLATMLRIVLPVTGVVLALLALNVLLAWWLVKRHRLDPTTAVLASVPGGFSELSVVAQKEGADVGTVAAVHLVRVLAVVLVVVPGLVFVLGQPA